MKRLITAHLNINSLQNKCEFLADQIKEKVDLLMASETKLDEVSLKVSSNFVALAVHLDLIVTATEVILCYLSANIFQLN